MRYNNIFYKIKRKLSAKIPPGAIIYYLMTVGVVYILSEFMGFNELYGHLLFNKTLILRGQVWRIVTFLLTPLIGYKFIGAVIFLIYAYFIITRIEAVWGPADTVIFLGFSAIAQIISGMIFGYADFSPTLFYIITFIYSIYFSNDIVYFLFLIPLKIKYFGIILSVFMIYKFAIVPMPLKISILTSILVFVIYFRKFLFENLRLFVRRMNNRINRR